MRYRGQSFELEVKDTTGDLATAFHRAHRERYGYAQEQSEIEIVSARVRSFGIVEKLAQRKIASGRNRARRDVYKREDLGAGARLKTPCIVTEYSATTLIHADCKARIDDFGNLLIEFR
jgi:N-methylhydantoinase A/oxoprolinase/acetone carboxylase beta subunit